MSQLTHRQAQVAALASTGKRNKAIADELGVGSETVKSHLKNIYKKLEITSRHEIRARLTVDDELRRQVLEQSQ